MSVIEGTNRAKALAEALKAFWPEGGAGGSHVAGLMLAGEGEDILIEDPVTGQPLITLSDAGEAIAREAAQAAKRGLAVWSAIPAAQRGRIMQAVGAGVRARVEELAVLEMLVSGKPIRDCRGEAMKVAEMFEYYGGWADKLHGEVIPVPTSHLNYTVREPFGVILQITPWNAPMFTGGWQVAPAISMGNAVVLKPSERTPFTSLALAKIAEEAGVPAGVINVLVGFGHTTGQAALAAPEVAKVVFVGSPEVGRHIASAAGRLLKPSVLELGGKSANIVFPDADLRAAALGAQAAIFAGAGQSCVAGSRLLVHRSVHDELVDLVARGAARIRVGDPADPATEVGPINNRNQYGHVTSMIAGALAEGAALGGALAAIPQDGFFVAPTVIAGATNAMTVAQEEVFGPVVAAIPFDTEEEAIALANDSRFGLAGAVWTGDVGRAHRVSRSVRAGTFWINSYKTINVASPFGGYGESGYGRSSGVDVLREYTQIKSVWVETAATPTTAFGYAPGLGT
ncbi:aldehyde dehydrogenase family protein [Novosphingobium sp. BL-52-GroH]|uniref:aldehyde dehydrogenase family protein n=1 Tax=Novosphingobium sp. BL-52-GroH TaxID=3349877 RepID=UPI003850FA22